MLNKEDILALAWEHSEGSGKRYTFTEESLFEFLNELKKDQAPAQDERRDAFNAADPELNDLLNLAVEIYTEGGNHDSAEYMMELLSKVEARLETRPAQKVNNVDTPEQQPIGRVFTDEERFRSDGKSGPVWWFAPLPAGAMLYAAPIAQTAPQPEQSGLVEALPYQTLFNAIASATKSIPGTSHISISVEAFRAALSAKGGE